ncbi:MAG: hypothetical protein DMF04_01205, partial [Verrucomicrobia bacterium]
TLGALISLLLSPSAWEVGLGVLLAMFLSHLLRLQGAAKVAGYVCGIVLFAYDDAPWSYALHRTIERMIGIALVRESDKIHKAFVNRDDGEISRAL